MKYLVDCARCAWGTNAQSYEEARNAGEWHRLRSHHGDIIVRPEYRHAMVIRPEFHWDELGRALRLAASYEACKLMTGSPVTRRMWVHMNEDKHYSLWTGTEVTHTEWWEEYMRRMEMFDRRVIVL